MKVTLYAPMTKQEARFWHMKLSEVAGVEMSQNQEADPESKHHTFFTLMADDPSLKPNEPT